MEQTQSSRVLVVPAGDARQRRNSLILAVCFGLAAGTGSELLAFDALHNPRWSPAVALLVLLAPLVAVSMIAATVTPRGSPYFTRAAAFWIAAVFGITLSSETRGTDGAARWLIDWPTSLLALAIPTVFAIVAAALATATRRLIHRWIVTPVAQDGQLCGRCGYSLGSDQVTTCPECGTPFNPETFRFAQLHRATRWLLARAPHVLLVTLVLIAALLTSRLPRTVQSFPFLWTFRSGEPATGFVVHVPRTGVLEITGLGRTIPVDLGGPDHLVVRYSPVDHPDTPAMELRPGKLSTSPAGRWLDSGSPPLVWRLARAQADHVARHGLPPDFLTHIRNEIKARGWQPSGGTMQQEIILDADDLIPAPQRTF